VRINLPILKILNSKATRSKVASCYSVVWGLSHLPAPADNIPCHRNPPVVEKKCSETQIHSKAERIGGIKDGSIPSNLNKCVLANAHNDCQRNQQKNLPDIKAGEAEKFGLGHLALLTKFVNTIPNKLYFVNTMCYIVLCFLIFLPTPYPVNLLIYFLYIANRRLLDRLHFCCYCLSVDIF